MNIRHYLPFYRPSHRAGWALTAAGVILALGVLLGALIAWGMRQQTPLSIFLLVVSLFTLPPASLALLLAAWLESRRSPRAVLLAAAGAALLLDGVLFAAAMAADPQAPSGVGGLAASLLCLPPCLVLGAMAGVTFWRGLPETRHLALTSLKNQVTAHLFTRGELGFDELAALLRLDEAATLELLREMAPVYNAVGEIDEAGRRVYTPECVMEKQERLLQMVRAHGEMRLADLQRELHLSEKLLKDWVISLVGAGSFSGYIHWGEGKLYSREAAWLSEQGACPNCGGELALAGRGVLHCPHCGLDIFR